MKVVGGSLALEGDSGTLRRLKKGGEVAVQVLGTVSLVDGKSVDFSVGVVERYVEGGSAYESSQPRHGFLSEAKPGIVVAEDFRQATKKKIMTQSQSVTVRCDGRQLLAETPGEILEGLVTIRVRSRGWPDPLYAERGFSPSGRVNASSVSDSNAGPGTGDGSESFRTEL